jgi:N-glycosylase/DNA lyase
MRLDPLDLDRTLSCGQVFRWRKEGDWWAGVVQGKEVRLRQRGCEVDLEGDMEEGAMANYLRADDDLDEIYQDIMISSGSERMMGILHGQRGLRLVRQDPWECSASFILATFVHIPRIEQMIERICRTYGDRLPGGRHAFPRPEQIVRDPEAAKGCGLGFRCERLVQFARMVDSGEVDLPSLKELPYEDCIKELKTLPGIGDKVADCIALFSLDHLEAFPVDVRIMRSMDQLFGMEGNYRKVSADSRALFGRYAGYAQEYIYLAMQRKARGN